MWPPSDALVGGRTLHTTVGLSSSAKKSQEFSTSGKPVSCLGEFNKVIFFFLNKGVGRIKKETRNGKTPRPVAVAPLPSLGLGSSHLSQQD